jgi:hypothetical protein
MHVTLAAACCYRAIVARFHFVSNSVSICLPKGGILACSILYEHLKLREKLRILPVEIQANQI